MKKFHKVSFGLLAMAILAVSAAEARDQIRIVGSSTVYPFSSAVAEELGAGKKYPTPVVESTGSGGGMKLFCKGNGLKTPDITNASRRMKTKEFKTCEENGVTDITEAIIGFDGIAFAQSNTNKSISLTKKQILLAVAAEVPDKSGKGLVQNPYKNWKEIDSSLPDREILIYGPPTSSGTRDAFEDMILKGLTKKMAAYGNKKYKKIRQDGVYVPSGENDNLIVQKLDKNPKAFGIFGYSFLVENENKVNGALIEGKAATPDNISSGAYPLSRSLFFYIKNSHSKDVPAMNEYVKLFMSDKMIGKEGYLGEIGLISLPEAELSKIRKSVENRKKLTLDDLAKK